MSSSWITTELGKVATLQRGYDLPHRIRKAGGVPIITSSGFGGLHCEFKASGPGVVTGRYGTIGEVFYISENFWPLNTTLYVRDFHGNNPLFISHLLKTIDFHTYSGKSGVPGVNRNDLHEINVRIPPTKTEQEAIATTLSDTDALIEALEQLIAKKRHIKQGTMQELLTGKRRLPGFGEGKGYKQIEVGVIPEDWEVFEYESFGQVIDGDRGSHYPSSNDLMESGYCLFLNAGNVTQNGFRFSHCQFISIEKDKVLNKGKLCIGDVVLTTRGTVGNFALYDKQIAFEHLRINSGMVILRNLSKEVSTQYQYIVLCSHIVESQIERLTFGSAQPQLTVKGINTLKIPVPPTITEQKAIATILSDMDTEIATLEAKLTKTRQLKQGMMHNLLTGRIRLI